MESQGGLRRSGVLWRVLFPPSRFPHLPLPGLFNVFQAEEVKNTGAYARAKQIAFLIGLGDMCQPLSSRNKRGNVPRQRRGWNLNTLANPDPHARAFCSRCRLLLFPDSLPTTPDNSHCRWHSTLTSVQLYWCSPGGIPSVNREFSTGTPCCKRDELHNAKI